MKKLSIFLCLLVTLVFAQSLNSDAKYIKKHVPEGYRIIKQHAKEKWGDDYEMAVYKVNKECKALDELVNKFQSSNTNILTNAIEKWRYDGYTSSNMRKYKDFSTISLDNLAELHCQCEMVKYYYDNQVEAKSAF